MTNNEKAERAITKAKVAMILNQPWFGALAMKLQIEDGAALGVDTMATDGTRLYYSADYVGKLSAAELEGVLAHEIMHCAFLHPYRRESRELKQWNIAADVAINDILLQTGFTLPRGVLTSKSTGLPLSLHAEKYYALLGELQAQGKPQPKDGNGKDGIGGVMDAPPQGQGQGKDESKDGGKGKGQGSQPQPQPGQGKGEGKGEGKGQGQGKGSQPGQGQGNGNGNGQPQPGTGQGSGGQDRTATDWVVDVIQAERVATAAGKMPGALATELRNARECKTDYREVLKRFIDRTVASDYRWSSPNRRMMGFGHVLPGLYKEGCGELVIGVDTSGSVHTAMLDQFSADIADILQTVRPSKIHVVYCDAAVGVVEEFEPDGEPFKFSDRVARGGTKFQPVFDWVEGHLTEAPKACLYLTDLEPCDRPRDPGYPVLWCVPESCTRKSWDWGEVVEVVMDDHSGGR